MGQINIPGVGVVNFPDTMSDTDITDAIRSKIVPQRMQEVYSDRKMPAVQKIQQLDQLDPTFKDLPSNDKVTRLMQAMQPGALQEATAPATWGQRGLEFSKGLLQAPLSDVAHGADIVTRNLGLPSPLSSKFVQSEITPEDTWAGRAGFDIGETAPYLIPIGGEIKGAGLLRSAARVGREALRSGAISGIQTGTKEGAETGAILGGGLSALGEGINAAGRQLYEWALKPPTARSAAERAAMVTRGYEGGLPIAQNSKDRLQAEVNLFRPMITRIMRDPVYAGRSIPVADLLKPVDDLIQKVQPASRSLAAALARQRRQWLVSLGGGTHTSAGAAQMLKEAIDAVLGPGAFLKEHLPVGGAAYKETRTALRESIERAIPERLAQFGNRTIHDINNVMHIDLSLKSAIGQAMNRKPNWLADAAYTVLGAGAGGLLDLLDQDKEHRGAGIAGAIALLTRVARHNPSAASRLALMLRRVGIAPLAALTPAIREESGVPKATALSPRETSTPATRPGPRPFRPPAQPETETPSTPILEPPEASEGSPEARAPELPSATPELNAPPEEVAEREPDNLPQMSRPYSRPTALPSTTEGEEPQPLLARDRAREPQGALRRLPLSLPLPGAPGSPIQKLTGERERAEGAMPRGNDLIEGIATAIERIEGSATKDRNQRNNNPGNLRPVGFAYRGQIDTDDQGFAVFKDRAAGDRALRMQIQINLRRGLSLNEFFGGKKGVYAGYAPKKDKNKPRKYASDVAKMIGVNDTDMPLSL